MEEREDFEMRKKKDEADELFRIYQQEKEKQRNRDAQVISESHLKQAVNSIEKLLFYSFVFFYYLART